MTRAAGLLTSTRRSSRSTTTMKVQAVLDWIDGFNHDRTRKIGVPAVLGMNFQIPNVA